MLALELEKRPHSTVLLDAHQHFWRYRAAEYPWIPAGSPLHRDWLPADLAALQRPLGLGGSIAVQARQSISECDWLLGLADADDRVRGVVGWVDLRSPNVRTDLERLAAHPKFAGVRHVVQDEQDPRFLIKEDFVRGMRVLHEFGLTYDLLIIPRQIAGAIDLVRLLPGQPFVIDHCAKPNIKKGARADWEAGFRELAKAPNVMCKVSGLVTEADHQHWKPEDLRPYLDVVFEAFGPERLMWGSDWPVCLLAAEYEKVFNVIQEYTRPLTNAQRQLVFGENCAKFYLKQ